MPILLADEQLSSTQQARLRGGHIYQAVASIHDEPVAQTGPLLLPSSWHLYVTSADSARVLLKAPNLEHRASRPSAPFKSPKSASRPYLGGGCIFACLQVG